jgi:hypothetical protein
MARLTDEELGEFVFKPREEELNEIHDTEERSVVAYTDLLKEVEEKDPVAYAKKVQLSTKIIYYVKRNKNGKLYNPNGIYSERQQNKQMRYGPSWSFREVSKKAFDYYTKFLETKNEAWLSNAERELA